MCFFWPPPSCLNIYNSWGCVGENLATSRMAANPTSPHWLVPEPVAWNLWGIQASRCSSASDFAGNLVSTPTHSVYAVCPPSPLCPDRVRSSSPLSKRSHPVSFFFFFLVPRIVWGSFKVWSSIHFASDYQRESVIWRPIIEKPCDNNQRLPVTAPSVRVFISRHVSKRKMKPITLSALLIPDLGRG